MATKAQTKSTKKLRFGVGLHYDVLGDAPAGFEDALVAALGAAVQQVMAEYAVYLVDEKRNGAPVLRPNPTLVN